MHNTMKSLPRPKSGDQTRLNAELYRYVGGKRQSCKDVTLKLYEAKYICYSADSETRTDG
jgi:hypothetical protein